MRPKASLKSRANNLIALVEFLRNCLQLTISNCFGTLYLTFHFTKIARTELSFGISCCVQKFSTFCNFFVKS